MFFFGSVPEKNVIQLPLESSVVAHSVLVSTRLIEGMRTCAYHPLRPVVIETQVCLP